MLITRNEPERVQVLAWLDAMNKTLNWGIPTEIKPVLIPEEYSERYQLAFHPSGPAKVTFGDKSHVIEVVNGAVSMGVDRRQQQMNFQLDVVGHLETRRCATLWRH